MRTDQEGNKIKTKLFSHNCCSMQLQQQQNGFIIFEAKPFLFFTIICTFFILSDKGMFKTFMYHFKLKCMRCFKISTHNVFIDVYKNYFSGGQSFMEIWTISQQALKSQAFTSDLDTNDFY
jgi:hypothetical protein